MTTPPSPVPLAEALAAGPVLLDGGLSTELEQQGHDVSGALWSARLLRDDPGAVVAAHRAFLDAGARVITTASYQATFEGFASAGLDRDEAERLLRRSVALARRAVDEAGLAGRAWVAASVGPYGAMLADGSEYTGAYAAEQGVPGLRRFHRPRLEVLADAGADVLACETVPALAEAEALVCEVDRLGIPSWLSLTTIASPGGSPRTRLGEDAVRGFAMARSVDAIIGVGVNCTEPGGLAAAVQQAATASGKFAVAYPNSGEHWDARARAWRGDASLGAGDVRTWIGLGARLVGGCCRIGPAAIRTIAAAARGEAARGDDPGGPRR